MRQSGDEIAFLSVASRDDVGPMRDFVERHDLTGVMPHVADVSGDVWARFGISGQPAWVFVDDSGEVERVFGALSPEDLERRLDELAAT